MEFANGWQRCFRNVHVSWPPIGMLTSSALHLHAMLVWDVHWYCTGIIQFQFLGLIALVQYKTKNKVA